MLASVGRPSLVFVVRREDWPMAVTAVLRAVGGAVNERKVWMALVLAACTILLARPEPAPSEKP